MPRIAIWILLAAAGLAAQDQTAPPAPQPAVPDLIASGQAAYMKGDYDTGRQAFQQALDILRPGPFSDPARYDVLKLLSSACAASGQFSEADEFIQEAISWRELNIGPNDPKIADDLLIAVGYARARSDFQNALILMGRVLSLHARMAGPGVDSINVADDFSRMGQIYAATKKLPEAIDRFKTALELRAKILGPLEPSLVYDLDRLGGLQIASRAYPEAEATYRYALVIRETLYGRKHADLIETVDGLAYALLGQKKYDEAEPLYKRLLELWESSVGTEMHPMVAMAYDKIALFYGVQKKWEQSDDAMTHANAIRAFLLADGLSIAATQQVEEGKMADALPLYERAIKVLDPPNPIYDAARTDAENLAADIRKTLKKPATQPAAHKK
jgi:tetratricopeptide (TPR) repeat protein